MLARRRRIRRIRLTRDVAAFLLGAGAFIHQIALADPVVPAIVAGGVALMLSPAVTRRDDTDRDREETGRGIDR